MNKVFIRHGDVNIHQVSAVKGKIVEHNGSFIVAHGESGHSHKITCERMVIRQDEKGFYLSLQEDGYLSHEEHKTITVPKGDYFVGREREMDNFSHAVRRVVD